MKKEGSIPRCVKGVLKILDCVRAATQWTQSRGLVLCVGFIAAAYGSYELGRLCQ